MEKITTEQLKDKVHQIGKKIKDYEDLRKVAIARGDLTEAHNLWKAKEEAYKWFSKYDRQLKKRLGVPTI